MLIFYFSMGLTILSGLLYHLFQKSVPTNINPIVSLMVTYLVAFSITLLLLPFFSPKISFISSLKELNWTSYALAFAIVGLEMGFLLAYRSSWNIGTAAILSNAAITLLLIPIGLILFKEKISIVNILGAVLCLIGLILIKK